MKNKILLIILFVLIILATIKYFLEKPDPKSFVIKGIDYEMIYCPAGSFMMGSLNYESGRDNSNEDLHLVKINKPFYIGKFEVTERQFRKAFDRTFRESPENDLPITLKRALIYGGYEKLIEKLNEEYFNSVPWSFKWRYKFALPTETQWEYACRAGTTTALNNDRNLTTYIGLCPNLDEVAWYFANSGGKLHPVGQKKPNAWGIYDMHGNIWEKCNTSYEYMLGYYLTKIEKGELSRNTEISRYMIKGGYCNSKGEECCSGSKTGLFYKGDIIGFRIALVPIEDEKETIFITND